MKSLLSITILLFFVGCSQKEVCTNPSVLDLSGDSMSFVRGGEFTMGDYNDTFGDKTPKAVFVDNFFIDKTEVTNAMYRGYLQAKPCAKKPKYIDDVVLGVDNLPVVGVTHKEASEFCSYYGKRLPTEAEWEYSARGAMEHKMYPWGDDKVPNMANDRDTNSTTPIAVMSYPPNTYGLYDMSGNVREWVEDTYEKDFYKYSCKKSPLNISGLSEMEFKSIVNRGLDAIYKSDCYSNPINLANGEYKVNRGGSYTYEGYPVSVSFRFFDDKNSRLKDVGFRCIQDFKTESWVGQKIKGFVNDK